MKMKKKLVLAFAVTVLALCGSAFGQSKTVVNSQKAKTMLLGRHKFSLQWISWDYFGTATVTVSKGVYRLKGTQKSRKDADFVTIDGVITEINEKNFVFEGKVVTQVSQINNGETCTREGKMTFRITGSRKYWRMQEINNPCDQVADYVDIFFR